MGIALLFAVAAACGQGEQKASSVPAAAPSAERGAPVPGEVRVAVQDGRVTVLAQAAPRGLVLEKLASAAGFELAGEIDAHPLTFDLKAQPLEPVLALLLDDLAYRAYWRFDARTDRHALTRLVVGEEQAAAAVAAGTGGEAPGATASVASRPDLRERRARRRAPGIDEAKRAEIAAKREERARKQADYLDQLRSSNPEMRAEAVEGLDAEDEALEALLALLRDDPDPRVREAAAEQVSGAEGYAVCTALLNALADREPAVALQALESLEFTCDESVGPIVQQRCGQAYDPALKERCAETVEFMQ